MAQWSQDEDAQSQYDNLTGAMTGKELGSGNVKVSGETTGAYSAKTDPNDETKAIAVWRNDTVVFRHWCQGFGAALLPAVSAVTFGGRILDSHDARMILSCPMRVVVDLIFQ